MRVDHVAAARTSVQDGIERQLTPPTPPPRRNPPPPPPLPPLPPQSIDPASTGTLLHSAQVSSGKSASATTSIATCTNTSTATSSPSLGSSSNGIRCYATRGCCVDCAVWSNHGTAIDREDFGDSSATSEYSESGGSRGSAGSRGSGMSSNGWSNSEKIGGGGDEGVGGGGGIGGIGGGGGGGGSLRQELAVAGSRCRVQSGRDPLVGKSAPSSFRKRDGTGGGGQSSSSATSASTGFARSVANGLKLAQTQAIAVAGFLADVDSRHDRICASCLSHRASYHGRGD
ncbi:muscle calcium channel subunit alpha-1 isoform X2 [Apis mellifera caucasica]|nr:muscle calcium channel subunit alpha-1 isoform X2 [Apis mellifera caucasica]